MTERQESPMKALAGPALLSCLTAAVAVFPVAARQDEPVPGLQGRIRAGRSARQRLRRQLGRGRRICPSSVFQVAEDDQPQQITFFSSVDVPVAVGSSSTTAAA